MAQWLELVHGKHEVGGSYPTWANFLYGVEKPQHKMNTIYIYIYIYIYYIYIYIYRMTCCRNFRHDTLSAVFPFFDT